MNLEIDRVKILFNPNTQYRVDNISNLLKQHAQLFEAITDELDEISEPLALSVIMSALDVDFRRATLYGKTLFED